jgi:hypothetical protein
MRAETYSERGLDQSTHRRKVPMMFTCLFEFDFTPSRIRRAIHLIRSKGDAPEHSPQQLGIRSDLIAALHLLGANQPAKQS